MNTEQPQRKTLLILGSRPAATPVRNKKKHTMNHPAAKTVTFGEGKTYTLDQYGFLVQPERWDEDFANGMARLQGIYDGLTKEHWDFVSYIREKFLAEKDLPLLVVACADNNLRLGKLKSLFPTGYFRGACRIATQAKALANRTGQLMRNRQSVFSLWRAATTFGMLQ